MAWADDFTWVDKSSKLGPTNLNKLNKAVRELKTLTFNVQDFGAKGDGTTDDSAAFAAMIAAMPATDDTNRFRATRVVLPPGEYKIASTLTFNSRVRILGHGAWLKPTSALTGDVVQLKMRQSVIEGLAIDGSNVSTGTGNGIRIGPGYLGDNVQRCVIRDVQVWSVKGYGIYWDDGPYARFDNVYVGSNGLGGYFMSGDYVDNNHGVFTGCDYVGTGTGYIVKDVTGGGGAQKSCLHTFLNCKAFGAAVGARIETNNNYGIFHCELVSGDDLTLTGANSFGNHIELLGDAQYTESSANRNLIEWTTANGSRVTNRLTTISSPSWSSNPVVDTGTASVTVSVPAVAIGDVVVVSGGDTTGGVLLYATPTSTAGNVRVTLHNRTGGSVVPPTTLYIHLIKHN